MELEFFRELKRSIQMLNTIKLIPPFIFLLHDLNHNKKEFLLFLNIFEEYFHLSFTADKITNYLYKE